MRFIKENSYEALRLYINQIGITIFSLVLYFAVSSIEDAGTHGLVKTLVSVFSTLFYFALIYTATWDIGAKDRIRVDGGRMKRQMYKGLLLGIFANALNLVLLLLSFSFYGFAGNGGFAAQVLGISTVVFRFTTGMYIGLVQAVFGGFESELFQFLGGLILVIMSILVIHIGYCLGMNERKLFSSGYSSKSKKQ